MWLQCHYLPYSLFICEPDHFKPFMFVNGESASSLICFCSAEGRMAKLLQSCRPVVAALCLYVSSSSSLFNDAFSASQTI
jgi:hypothetical protein